MVWGTLLTAGVAALVVTLALTAAVPSTYIRARLRFSAWLLLAFLGLQIAVAQGGGNANVFAALARLAFVLAVINLFISLALNPWRESRPSDRFPAILQDVALFASFATVAVLMNEELLTTSAVGAVVVGFALQDTLGNLFAGLAIQIEKPFRVGHWIAIGDREGQVQQVTWRATKLLTKHGEFLIIPNSTISGEPILNYSEPTVPTRLTIEVGVSYQTPPNEARAALLEALGECPLVLKTPAPAVFLHNFGDFALVYHVWFWLGDYGLELEALDQVRTHIWYTFRRRNIEIPYPTAVEIGKEDKPPERPANEITSAANALGAIDMFSTIDAETRLGMARTVPVHIFAGGEHIVRQGDSGSSMYIVLSGRARVVLEPSGQEVATIPSGGFFGEMSMLTGEPRTASVVAVDDVRVMEMSAERFRELALDRPGLVEHISAVVAERRVGLESARAAAAAAGVVAAAPRTLLKRIQQFLHLP